MTPIRTAQALIKTLRPLKFAKPVAYVYNPLVYAWPGHKMYLEKWGQGKKKVLLLGMNPGPWGMAQTGVPFGEVSLVRDWMGVSAPISRPAREHPKRPITGFATTRSEVSGARLWGWARERFTTPARFFKNFLIINYCPLSFMEEGGRNVTPDKLPVSERTPLLAACDEALRRQVDYYQPDWVIGVGAWAQKRATEALGDRIRIGTVLHPSPASPAANRGWAPQAERQFHDLGLSKLLP
jgi:single-strand selective monofunctional uracil DNA glycosylase